MCRTSMASGWSVGPPFEGRGRVSSDTKVLGQTPSRVRAAWTRRTKRQNILVCQVLISHTGQDKLAANLSNHVYKKRHVTLDTFLDSKWIHPGDLWRKVIEENASRCQVIVCLLSPNYFRRYWCLHELDLAMQAGCRILPVRCRGFLTARSQD